MTFEISHVNASHVHHVATNLRNADRVEAEKLNANMSPYAQVMQSAENSSLLLGGTYDDEPVAVAGVVRTEQDEVGIAWMVTTDWVYDHVHTFMRESGHVLDAMYHGGDWQTFVNIVHTSNVLHEKWLTQIGAQWHPQIQKINGAYFRAFYLHKEELGRVYRRS